MYKSQQPKKCAQSTYNLYCWLTSCPLLAHMMFNVQCSDEYNGCSNGINAYITLQYNQSLASSIVHYITSHHSTIQWTTSIIRIRVTTQMCWEASPKPDANAVNIRLNRTCPKSACPKVHLSMLTWPLFHVQSNQLNAAIIGRKSQ